MSRLRSSNVTLSYHPTEQPVFMETWLIYSLRQRALTTGLDAGGSACENFKLGMGVGFMARRVDTAHLRGLAEGSSVEGEDEEVSLCWSYVKSGWCSFRPGRLEIITPILCLPAWYKVDY